MKASSDKKVDLAKDILVAYMAHSPEDSRNVDAVLSATKRIFEAVDSMVETVEGPKEPAGFKL